MHVRRKLFEDDGDMYGEASGSWNQSKPTWLAENWNAPFVQVCFAFILCLPKALCKISKRFWSDSKIFL